MEANNFQVKFTPIAYEDIDAIFLYIQDELQNYDAANNLIDNFYNSIMRLKEFPFSCSFVSDDTLKNKGYRNLIVNNYIVFYLVNESEKLVIIMRILYNKQKYQDFI